MRPRETAYSGRSSALAPLTALGSRAGVELSDFAFTESKVSFGHDGSVR